MQIRRAQCWLIFVHLRQNIIILITWLSCHPLILSKVLNFIILFLQLAFGLVIYPCLVVQYMGQAAFLSKNIDSIPYSFYYSIPGECLLSLNGLVCPPLFLLQGESELDTVKRVQKTSLGLYITCLPWMAKLFQIVNYFKSMSQYLI